MSDNKKIDVLSILTFLMTVSSAILLLINNNVVNSINRGKYQVDENNMIISIAKEIGEEHVSATKVCLLFSNLENYMLGNTDSLKNIIRLCKYALIVLENKKDTNGYSNYKNIKDFLSKNDPESYKKLINENSRAVSKVLSTDNAIVSTNTKVVESLSEFGGIAYIQYVNPAQENNARSIKSQLNNANKNLIVPNVDYVENIKLSNTEIRYFNGEDSLLAIDIKKTLDKFQPQTQFTIKRLFAKRAIVPKGQIEIWLK